MNHSEADQLFSGKLLTMTGGVAPKKMESFFPILKAIRELKKQHGAIVLSHYYMPPELQITTEQGGIADFVGDSLGLSLAAKKTKAPVIIFCGVKFMAETASIMNPGKKVLIPDMGAGCSLASSISANDVKKLKEQYPGVPVIGYINTYAETKAECDVICTSRNALSIARSFPGNRIIFIPDMHMGNNLAAQFQQETGKELILWNGVCEVHDQFRNNIKEMAAAFPEAEMLLHWEVPDNSVRETLAKNQGVLGSTSDILQYVARSSAKQFILGSECDLGASLKSLYPDKEFITPCLMCRYMKKIDLNNTRASLESIGTRNESQFLVELPPELCKRAMVPLNKMLHYIN